MKYLKTNLAEERKKKRGKIKQNMETETNLLIKVGDKLKLGVTKFGKDGDPIMIKDGFVIFLKGIEKRGIQLNKMIEIQITKVLPKFAFAERTNEN